MTRMVLLLFALAYVRPAAAGEGTPPLAEVLGGPFDILVVETAVVDARSSVTIASDLPSNSAKIAWIVADGAWVETDQPVVRFDREPFLEALGKLEREHAEAEAALAQAESEKQILIRKGQEQIDMLSHQIGLAELELEQFRKADRELALAAAQGELLGARSALQQARLDAETQRRLAGEGFGSEAALLQAESVEREKEAAVARFEAALRLQETVVLPATERELTLGLEARRREHGSAQQAHLHTLAKQSSAIVALESRVADLAHQVERSRTQLDQTELVAPVSGFAVHVPTSVGNEFRKVQVGDSVWNRHGFMVLPDMSSLIAQIRIREVDLGKVAVGQPVTLVPDAYPELRLTGEVEGVGTLAERSNDTEGNAFTVRVGISGGDPRLRPGMRARAEVLSRHFEQATRVPVEAVFRDGGETVCFLWNGRRAERRVIEMGESNGMEVVVRDGVTPGDRVLIVHPDTWVAER